MYIPCWYFVYKFRPVGRGVRGGSSEPPFWPPCKRFYMHHLTVYFERSTIWNWFSSLHAIENHCRPNKFGHGGPARNVCVSCLRHCDERMCVNKCIAISGAQEFTSRPPNDVTPPAVLPNLVPFLLEIRSQLAGLANAYVNSQKLECNIFHDPFSYYGSASVPKWPQKQSQSI